MSRVDPQRPLLPSVLDRLLDDEPDLSAEPGWRHSYTVRKLREDVRRDLEWLLNTRCTRPDLIRDDVHLARSTLAFGIPDVMSTTSNAPEDRQRLCEAVAECIRRFEPRLRDVRVQSVPPADRFTRAVRLIIDAVLCVEPVVDRVTFDTLVEATEGNCEVRVPNR